jgi:hypothetical protein
VALPTDEEEEITDARGCWGEDYEGFVASGTNLVVSISPKVLLDKGMCSRRGN